MINAVQYSYLTKIKFGSSETKVSESGKSLFIHIYFLNGGAGKKSESVIWVRQKQKQQLKK